MSVTASPTAAAGVEWVACPGCRSVVYGKRWRRQMQVCLDCGRHGRLNALDRLVQILDPGSAQILDIALAGTPDPLGFHDSLPYPERVRAARASVGLPEAVVCARGTMAETSVIAAVMDFRFLGGSLGSHAGELVTIAAETALRERAPLLLVTASGGARMQEGAISLMQMAKTSQALGQLDEAGVLTVCVVTDPTYGGVAASFATLCDIIVAEPGARLGFAGPRVIQQTIGEVLPSGFQTAEFLLARGLIDTIRPRTELRAALGRMVSTGTRQSWPPGEDDAEDRAAARHTCLIADWQVLPERDPWESVQRARALGRPTTLDYINLMITDFEELNGDRVSGDCPAIIGGLGRLQGIPLVIIGHQKGHNAAQLTERNFGMATPPGYRKAARLMRLAAKLGLPVVTLIDTPGAYPGIRAEEQGQAVAIAENLRLMAGLPVPVVAVITGEGGSGGALALAVADQVLMCENAIYSAISPEGCAAILWNDAAVAPTAAAALRLDARELLRLGVVDGVLPEPPGGTQADHEQAAERLQAALVASLGRLGALDAPSLVHRRRARFRAFGRDTAVTVDVAAAGDGAHDG